MVHHYQRTRVRRSSGVRWSGWVAVAMDSVAFALAMIVAGGAYGGSPWYDDGHCQFGSVYDPPVGGIYMTDTGRSLRQCNSTSTADHGSADVGGNGFTVYRTNRRLTADLLRRRVWIPLVPPRPRLDPLCLDNGGLLMMRNRKLRSKAGGATGVLVVVAVAALIAAAAFGRAQGERQAQPVAATHALMRSAPQRSR